MYCKYLNLRNNEELAQITMRKRNSTLNQSTPNCPGLIHTYMHFTIIYRSRQCDSVKIFIIIEKSVISVLPPWDNSVAKVTNFTCYHHSHHKMFTQTAV